MKKISTAFVTILAACATCSAWAADGGNKPDLSYLTSGGPDQTPYQKIQDLFNRATPMQLSQFLRPNDPALKNWNCTGVKPDTTAAQITPLNEVPVVVSGKIVTTPANPAGGPLFPGTPEQDKTVTAIWLAPNDGSFSLSDTDIGNNLVETKDQLTTSPGVVDSFLIDPNDPTSETTMTYRSIDGLIVVHISASAAFMARYYDYFYCYQQ